MPKLTLVHYILIAVGLWFAYKWYKGRQAAATPVATGGGGGMGGGYSSPASAAPAANMDSFLDPTVDTATGNPVSLSPAPQPSKSTFETPIEPITAATLPKGASVVGTSTNPFVDSNTGK